MELSLIDDLEGASNNDEIHCPSAPSGSENSVVLGVINGTVNKPHVKYVSKLQPPTKELLALSDPVDPEEVFRFAAPCINESCIHYDGKNCLLASRIVESLPQVVVDLPHCRLRSKCRWWKQEGRQACVRCPQIVRNAYHSPESDRVIAAPSLLKEE